jgi:hypothetical protein
MCEFKAATGAYFRSEDIDLMASADVVPLFPREVA